MAMALYGLGWKEGDLGLRAKSDPGKAELGENATV
jgi:hypothetical protein